MKRFTASTDSTIFAQIDPPKLKIPKCSSTQQFFTLNSVKKRKQNAGLGYSLKLESVEGHTRVKHCRKDSEGTLSWKPSSQAITDATICQNGIAFKNSKQKRKINNICIENHLEEKAKPQILSQIHQLSWNQSQKQSPFRHARKLRKNNLKNTDQPYSMSDFKVIRKIGQGNFSQVFSAYQRKTGFLCAIKKLKKSYLWENDLVDVIIREIKIHFYLKHANIIDLYGWFDDKDYVYLICQYCCEGDLYKFLQKKAKNFEQIGVYECSYLLNQVCDAVAAMHQHLIMHRDIKPENVFLTIGNVAKLGDLGWSVSYANQNLRVTHCGTPLYLAPELLQDKCQYSHSVDIWALGILSYELLTGQIPFKINQIQDMNKILTEDINFDCFDNQIARNFVERLLQKDKKKRVNITQILEHPFLRMHEQHYF